MIKKYAFLILSFLVFANVSRAQLSFDHLTVANGLSQSAVLSICQDKEGYMWFGTRDRLNRYDARHFKIFNHSYKDPGSISCSDYILSLCKDRNGNLWVGTVRGLDRYIPEKDAFEHVLKASDNINGLNYSNIYSIYQDRRGRLWFGTNNGLLMLPNPASKKFIKFHQQKPGSPGLTANNVYAVFEDEHANLWLGTSGGVTVMKPNGNAYSFASIYPSKSGSEGLAGSVVRTITEDRQHQIWMGTETGGISIYDPDRNTFTHFQHNDLSNATLSSNDVRKILVDRQGRIWVGTISGLNRYEPGTKTFSHFDHDVDNRNSLSDNSIKDIYQDNNGTIWIGTMYGGVNILHLNAIPFNAYQYNKYRNSISSNIISSITADEKTNLWVGTEGSGLNYLDRKTGIFTHYINSPTDKRSITTNFVKAIYKDEHNRIWIGLHNGGLELYDPVSQKFKHFLHDPGNAQSISSNVVSSVLEDSQGRFWVGTSAGLNLFDKAHGTFTPYGHLSSPVVRCIYEDSRHNIWVGTTIGLNLLAANKTGFKWFTANEQNQQSLQVGYINCITEDLHHNIWIGSFHGGLSKYNPGTGTFINYSIAQGLPSDNVLNIQPGDGESLWISTDNGLSRFDLLTRKFKNFTVKDGLPANEFNYNSSYKDANGDLYFGTYNGLVSFSPKKITENHFVPTIVFTGLRLFNQSVSLNDKTGLLKQGINYQKELEFTHDQNAFAIDFSALSFEKPDRNRYKYKMNGFDKDWNYVSTPTATYTNLPTGDYEFMVMGSNNDGVWSKGYKSMYITVLPPLWKTWWAYLIYAVVLFILLVLIIRFFRKQARLERDLYHEQANHEREQALYQHKLDFFTHISHEIRTPLTLILAPVEKLSQEHDLNQNVSAQIGLIKRNTNRLIGLVDELLDFRKIETGNTKLKVTETDLVKFSSEIFQSFVPLSISKQIDFRFVFNSECVLAFIDTSQLEKVLNNLLSNAFKFTPDNGTIELRITEHSGEVSIKVTDNGPGIPANALPKLFEQFYQHDAANTSGWGIGLALSKRITELHGGQIKVDSRVVSATEPGNTSFTIEFLKGSDHFTNDQIINNQFVYDEPQIGLIESNTTLANAILADGKPSLLLVEDSDEVRGFIVEVLQNDYCITQAKDGADGFAAAIKIIPDLIISDVAMPLMDGFELCKKLKIDIRTSHIPVILLTAKAAPGQMISGLETGADDYITKPFSLRILQLKIRNLLLARDAMRQRFSQQVTLMPNGREITSPEERFLNKLMQIVESNLDNTEFDVLKLVDEMGMSQTALYRKIKALTGMTITDFIKSSRMKQAAALLRQNKLSIAEVAYTVGFNDRKYFSKEFKKQFGKAPSEFMG